MNPLLLKRALYGGLAKKMRGNHLDELRQKYGAQTNRPKKDSPIPGVEEDMSPPEAMETASDTEEVGEVMGLENSVGHIRDGGKQPAVSGENIEEVQTEAAFGEDDALGGLTEDDVAMILQQSAGHTEH